MRNRFRLISAGSGRIATERPDIDADMGATHNSFTPIVLRVGKGGNA
jgi:hypothetical protein